MKLTRLRLLGFKSFVEPTDFLIEPGLTGVVGPNGCGKSNLVEALRWVMGESSYKSMRASVDGRRDLFRLQHTARAQQCRSCDPGRQSRTRSAPAAFNDQETLDIARRIEREAGSTYRINGREVRARDVQILFADASTGARSPALVHQGRIGEIIQAKPEQRRRVLEEAAGVAGLHARRHEAELRLKAAETNLLRIEDVIGQLAGQMEALKKQARQAIRYRTVSAQVRKAEATLYHLRWTAANSEVAEAEQVKDQSVREVAARTGAQAEAAEAPGARRSRPARSARRRGARRRRTASPQSRIAGTRPRGSSAPRIASRNLTCGSCSLRPTASASRSSPPMPKPLLNGWRRKKKRSGAKRPRAPAGAAASTPKSPKPNPNFPPPKIFSRI